jgi:hypothetical protein
MCVGVQLARSAGCVPGRLSGRGWGEGSGRGWERERRGGMASPVHECVSVGCSSTTGDSRLDERVLICMCVCQ